MGTFSGTLTGANTPATSPGRPPDQTVNPPGLSSPVISGTTLVPAVSLSVTPNLPATPSPVFGASSPASSTLPVLTPTSVSSPTRVPALTLPPLASPTPNPENDLSSFAPGLRPAFVGDLETQKDIPRYFLNLSIDLVKSRLSGTERIFYLNRSGAPLNDLALRLYPNFPRTVLGNGGNVKMEVTAAAVSGQPVTPVYAAQRTAILLPLSSPIAPREAVSLEVSFSATIASDPDGSWPLPSYYPMLAIRENSNWRLDVTTFEDHVYAESALYSANISVPSNLELITGGKIISRQSNPDGTTTFQARTGPVREFAISLGDFVLEQANAGEVEIKAYKVRGSILDARQVARQAASVVMDYEKRFGPYPYPLLNFHLEPGSYDGGNEFPGLIFLFAKGQVNPVTRYFVGHETAHQWWYGVVGDDIYGEAWLDEAFAQYSGIIFDEDVEGPLVTQSDFEREVQTRYRTALSQGNFPVKTNIKNFSSWSHYYQTVYGKGALFLYTLRQELGDGLFFKALQIYYQRYRYKVSTTEGVQKVMEEVSGKSLESFFKKWIYGP